MKAYTYRYLYQIKDKDELQVFFKTGSSAEHADVMTAIKNDDKIIAALREYVCEYDTDFVAKIEKIKIEEVTENEENCN